MATVYAVASAKGGVGKTTTAANLAVALASADEDVVAVDADIGMANLAGALGVDVTESTLHDALAGRVDPEETIHEGPEGLRVIPGETDLDAYAEADPAGLSDVLTAVDDADYVVIDCGAGLSHDSALPIGLADETLLVSTPERDALIDTEKTRELTDRLGGDVVGAAITRVSPGDDVDELVAELLDTAILGRIPEDDAVAEAVAAGKPVCTFSPYSNAAAAYRTLATALTGVKVPEPDLAAVTVEEREASEPAESAEGGETADAEAGEVAEGAEAVEAVEVAEASATAEDSGTAEETEATEDAGEMEPGEEAASESAHAEAEAEGGAETEAEAEVSGVGPVVAPEAEGDDAADTEKVADEGQSSTAESEIDGPTEADAEDDEPAGAESEPEPAGAESEPEPAGAESEPEPAGAESEPEPAGAESESEPAEPDAEEEPAESESDAAIPDAEPGRDEEEEIGSIPFQDSDRDVPGEGESPVAGEDNPITEAEDAGEDEMTDEEDGDEAEEKKGFFSRLFGR